MKNDLEQNLSVLVEAKVISLETTLGGLVKAGALAGLEPWDVWCGNGWIIRRRWPGPLPRFNELEQVREVIRDELAQAGIGKVRGA